VSDTKFRWTAGSVGLLVAVILIALMWAYILLPFSKHPGTPTTLKDTSFTTAAEQACAAAEADIGKLPKAETAQSPEERAVVLIKANAIVAALVKSLEAIEPKTVGDRQFTDQWLADWNSYLASRQAYAQKLAAGEDDRFAVQAEGGHPITERMDGFAQINGMPSCQTPLDV
jgi:hypothetical protein